MGRGAARGPSLTAAEDKGEDRGALTADGTEPMRGVASDSGTIGASCSSLPVLFEPLRRRRLLDLGHARPPEFGDSSSAVDKEGHQLLQFSQICLRDHNTTEQLVTNKMQ